VKARPGQEGLSPVVGTLLLFLVLLAIAATVWVMLNHVTKSQNLEPRPELAFQVRGDGVSVEVVRASPGLDWVRDLRQKGDCTPTLNGNPYPTAEGTPVQSTDVLGCAAGQELVVAASPERGNSVLYRHAF
jgi:hypothetical protein